MHSDCNAGTANKFDRPCLGLCGDCTLANRPGKEEFGRKSNYAQLFARIGKSNVLSILRVGKITCLGRLALYRLTLPNPF